MPDLTWALDTASHQPRDLTQIITDHQPGHIICRLYLTVESPGQQYSKDQVASCRANGVSVGGYVWGYRSVSPSRTIGEAIDLCAQMDLVLPLLWIDLETYGTTDPGPDAAWLREAIATANALQTRVGLYSADWWVSGVFPGRYAAYVEFLDLPHWLASYGSPTTGLDGAYWGGPVRPNVVARQWSGGEYTGDNLDHDILLPTYAYVEAPQPPAPPPPEPPQPPGPDLAARVEALEVEMAATVKQLDRLEMKGVESAAHFKALAQIGESP